MTLTNTETMTTAALVPPPTTSGLRHLRPERTAPPVQRCILAMIEVEHKPTK